MNILVTGATGFIGKNLIPLLTEQGYKLTVIVRNSNFPCEWASGAVKTIVDDQDAESLIKTFKNSGFDGVIHLATYFCSSHRAEDIRSLIESNITFGARIAEAAVNENVKWFINTGSFWQHYNGLEYSPVNLYAATKQGFEVILDYYRENSSTCFTTLELGDTYGENDVRSKLLNIWRKIIGTDESLAMSPGEQMIDLLHVSDVCNGFLLLVKNLESQAEYYNGKSHFLAGNEMISIRNLAKLAETVSGKKLNIVWGGRPYREREIMIPSFKGTALPGWSPRIQLKDGLKSLFSHHHGNL